MGGLPPSPPASPLSIPLGAPFPLFCRAGLPVSLYLTFLRSPFNVRTLAARLTRFAVHRVSRVLTPMGRRFPGRRVLDSETAQAG